MTALRKDLIREIKNSKNRFLSIAILIALAVAFLSGLKATAPDMKNTGMNIWISSSSWIYRCSPPSV